MEPNIGDILVDLGYASNSDIEKAVELQRASGGTKRLGEILLSELVLKDENLLHALSIQFKMPLLPDDQIPEVIPIDKISCDFLKENLVLPLNITDSTLTIAMADPTNTNALESLRASFDYEIKPYLAKGSIIREHIERLYSSGNNLMRNVLEDIHTEVSEEADVSRLRDLAQEKGIIKLVNIIVERAVSERASDIHVEPEETSVRVRYRIDGILHTREMLPTETHAALSSRIKLLAHMNIAERRLPQDGRIESKFFGKEIDIRVSTIPTVYGESIVMRILDRESVFMNFDELGLEENLREEYESLLRRPYGMILITGPTGSGKTTTLYASLDRIHSFEKKIITVEEPVEYLLKGVNQIQVKPKIGLTFASGLRHIVRQDPDVIMVGEIRDLETANIAVHAALTGHLLFSTLHTNDSSSAITRISDMGVENYLLSSTVIGIMAQRLVRRICPDCKEKYETPHDIASEFGREISTLWRGRGCSQCLETGYRGRVGIFELLYIDEDIRKLIIRGASASEIKEKAISSGMRTLRADGVDKVKKGFTTMDEVLRVSQVEL